jgi:hypothetical protein
MKKTQLAVTAACIGLLFAACQKDKPTTGKQFAGSLKEDPIPIENDVMAAWFAQNREEGSRLYVIDSQEGGDYWCHQGIHLTIAPESVFVTEDGNQYMGLVYIKLLEVMSPGYNLLYNFTTESSTGEEGQGLLATAGSYEMSMFTPDGTPITAEDVFAVTVEIPGDEDDGADGDMQLWQGVGGLEQARDNAWELFEDDPAPTIVNGRYRFPARNWRRCNVDKNVNYSGETTTLRVDLPGSLDRSTAEIFVAFPNDPNLRGALASMDVYDMNEQLWREHGGLANVGQELTLIALAYINGEMQAAFVEVTVEEDQVIDIEMSEFSHLSHEELVETVNALFP